MSTKVLVVDDKRMMRDSVATTLQRGGYQVVAASDGASALSLIAKHRPAAVITDLKMPEMDGLELLQRIRAADDQLPVILMTAYGTVDAAVDAMKSGAFDFIQKPFEGKQLVMTVRRAVDHRKLVEENAALRASRADSDGDGPMLVGHSRAMKQVAQQIQHIANSHGTVLISGESGTGKEVVARVLHAHSPRRGRVMLCLNCAALSGSLLESELFGHEKGAFTGADQLRKGRFELADHGTLLLDEISEIDPSLQAKLLRVLQERQFERVGSSMTMQVDVRVIATTNRDLGQFAASGLFRQDLYYRLNVLPIHLPPLRERLEDVPLLASHFLSQTAMREGREPKVFDAGAVELLGGYSWPGNVRELQNICERASVLTRGQTIGADLIRPWLVESPAISTGMAAIPHPAAQRMAETHAWAAAMSGGGAMAGPGGWVIPQAASLGAGYASPAVGGQGSSNIGAAGATAVVNQPGAAGQADAIESGELPTLEETERQQVLRALDQFNGNRRRAAEALGIGLRTLGLKLKKWKEQNLVASSV